MENSGVHTSDLWEGEPTYNPVQGHPLPFFLESSGLYLPCSPSSQRTALGDPESSNLRHFLISDSFFSSRKSDGQKQHFPPALDLLLVDLVPSHPASPYPKVSDHSLWPWPLPHHARAGRSRNMTVEMQNIQVDATGAMYPKGHHS